MNEHGDNELRVRETRARKQYGVVQRVRGSEITRGVSLIAAAHDSYRMQMSKRVWPRPLANPS